MAPPLRLWANLHPDLLVHIADRIHDVKGYASARGACTSWRRALAPPFPALLAAAEGATMSRSRPSAAPLLSPDGGGSFELAPVAAGSRCVGSNGGWLALCVHNTAFFLANPVTGAEIALPRLLHERRWTISKAVFAPSPAADDFAIAAIVCDTMFTNTIIYATAGATSWAVLGPVIPDGSDHLADFVYHDEGHKVYILTRCGNVHVLHLPERRRRKPAIVLDATKLSVLRPPEGIGVMQHYHPGMDLTVPATVSAEPQEPELSSSPARIEPLQPATAFAPPYQAASAIANAKHLVFCEGNMYQVWRNTSCNVRLQMLGVGQQRHRVLLGEVIVLRYYPNRGPCSSWDVVKDLGGYSFFVGRNNSVSVYAEGVPGLRGNCVYWIDGYFREKSMVFDMATGRTTPCRPPAEIVAPDGCRIPRRVCLWYFLSDTLTTDSSDGGRKLRNTQQQAASN
ncbi:unnamed protein product [Urochloa humidicola]